MLNSIGPLGVIGLLVLVFALFVGGFFVGHGLRRKDNNNAAGAKTPCFGLTECLVIAVDLLFIGAGAFFANAGDSSGAVIFGLGAALSTGILWGLSNCDFGHARMF